MSTAIYVSYPRQEGINFDLDYYINTHMKLVEKHWGPHGMKSWTIVQFDKDDPSGKFVTEETYHDSSMRSLSCVDRISKTYRDVYRNADTCVQSPGQNVQCIMLWTSMEDFEKCFALGIPEVHEDLKHYTNGMPVRWTGKVVATGQGPY
ncbi:hypothetical protein LTR05_007689 [Lithohypha guttulata]|uniref:EthD domain-containing protein n=1 Tax=Lithohypha guttulata TaxID=1690604 RepID=A0AAN7SU17_9EURO|nr:hypothetical protein LTR05_007689 [Lithohypha guttulata]